jgi:hypothetical protein
MTVNIASARGILSNGRPVKRCTAIFARCLRVLAEIVTGLHSAAVSGAEVCAALAIE